MFSKNSFLVLVFFFTCSFFNAQEKSLTLKELCKESSDIVIGTPVAINSYKSDDEKNIYTLIDISVEKKLKGNLDNHDVFRLTMFGGTIDGITTYAVGFPKFSLKMKSFFFLKEEHIPIEQLNGPQRVLFITGLSQGKMDIFERNGEKILMRDYDPSLKLEDGGESISFSNNNPVTTDKMISYITDLLNN